MGLICHRAGDAGPLRLKEGKVKENFSIHIIRLELILCLLLEKLRNFETHFCLKCI